MSQENEVERFTVHVFPRIRVSMQGLRATSHAAAAEMAATVLNSTNWDGVRGRNFASLVERTTVVQLDSGVTIASIGFPEDYDHQFLVDREAEVIESKEIASHADQHAARAKLSKKFLNELYYRHQFWSCLDAGVLANVLYLQLAILNDGTIFLNREVKADMVTHDLLGALPSAVKWMKFVREEE